MTMISAALVLLSAVSPILFPPPDLASGTWHVIPGHSRQTFTIVLNADVLYRIAVNGESSSDLDLRVYDENGNLVASDVDGTSQCRVFVEPVWRGPFTIEVRNIGFRSNLYELRID
jgi:hypothetical protein